MILTGGDSPNLNLARGQGELQLFLDKEVSFMRKRTMKFAFMLLRPPPSKLDPHWILPLLTHPQNTIRNDTSRLHAPSFILKDLGAGFECPFN